jgi:acetyl esterase/lipase
MALLPQSRAAIEAAAGTVQAFEPGFDIAADLEHPDLAPLLSDRLADLPPTLVVTAEHDPLRDEGEELVRRLGEAGVRVAGGGRP